MRSAVEEDSYERGAMRELELMIPPVCVQNVTDLAHPSFERRQAVGVVLTSSHPSDRK